MDNPPWLTYLRPLVGLSSLGCWGIEVPALERSQKSEYFSVNLLMIGCLMSGATEVIQKIKERILLPGAKEKMFDVDL